MTMGPREGRTLHAMSIDDAYEVQRVLSSGPGGRTEIVTIDGIGPYLRKKIPLSLVDRRVWVALSECDNPRLPHVAATYETPDEFVVVLEFIPGDTVSEVVSAQGHLSAPDAVRTICEVCEAISDLHRKGIVHCDISPRNVLLAADGAHVIDLGIARPVGTEPSSEAPVLGTHGFAAPEQYGFARVDERTDVYAAARLLGFMLTGLELGDSYRNALADEFKVPVPLRAVIERGSAFEPSARYQTMRDLSSTVSRAAGLGDSQSRFSQVAVGSPDSAYGRAAECKQSKEEAAACRSASVRTTKKRVRRLLAGAACAIALLCLGVLALSYLQSQATSRIADAIVDQVSGNPQAENTAPPSSSDLPESGGSFGQGPGASAASPTESTNALVVTESAWTNNEGYVQWIACVRNDGEKTVRSSKLQVAGRSGDGHVVSSTYQELRPIKPGEMIYFAGISDNGNNTESMDFSIRPSNDGRMQGGAESDLVLEVIDLSEVGSGYGSLRFAGEIALAGGDYIGIGNGVVLVTVVLRDEAGVLVGGVSTTLDQPAVNAPQTFDTLELPKVPYASVEAYAYEW